MILNVFRTRGRDLHRCTLLRHYVCKRERKIDREIERKRERERGGGRERRKRGGEREGEETRGDIITKKNIGGFSGINDYKRYVYISSLFHSYIPTINTTCYRIIHKFVEMNTYL